MTKQNNCKKYLWLHGFRSQLSKRITKKDGLLPLTNAAELAEKLALGYSYLTISDGVATEVVRVERFGNDIKMERGAENTQAQAFPSGACVVWEICESGIVATIENWDGGCGLDDEQDCGCG